MEKIRQNIESIGRILFAQCTEIVNPATNKGLPPNLVSCEPSESWLFKMVDINLAALQGELGFLAHPVNHVHTVEMGNQSIHSLALISARYTHVALGILTQMIASHFLLVCQALDLRVMQAEFLRSLEPRFLGVLKEKLRPVAAATEKGSSMQDLEIESLHKKLWKALPDLFDRTTNMDSNERFQFVATSLQSIIFNQHVTEGHPGSSALFNQHLHEWTTACAKLMSEEFLENRTRFFTSGDATPYLGFASTKMYKFIREDLGVPFLRTEDLAEPEDLIELEGLSMFEGKTNSGPVPQTTGGYITKIYEALRNGVMYGPSMDCLREAMAGDV